MLKEHRLTYLGNVTAGKTSLILRIIQGRFTDDTDCWESDDYRKKVNINGEDHLLDLIDTFDDEYSALRDQYIRRSEGLFLVYSITDHKSFEAIDGIIEDVYRVRDDTNVPMVLIGCKCDLEDKREVTSEEGKSFAEGHGMLFFETSAKTGVNVDESLKALIEECEEFSLLGGNENDDESKKGKREKCVIQ